MAKVAKKPLLKICTTDILIRPTTSYFLHVFGSRWMSVERLCLDKPRH